MYCPYPVGWLLLDEREGHTDIATFLGLLILSDLNFVKISSRYRRMFVILLNHTEVRFVNAVTAGSSVKFFASGVFSRENVFLI